MPEYVFGCKRCGNIVEITRSITEGPPEKNPICPRCETQTRRIYLPLAVQYHAPGFSGSLRDRPDERLTKEIRASQDFDPVTGKTWEETDKHLERKKARFGTAMKKQFALPQKKNHLRNQA